MGILTAKGQKESTEHGGRGHGPGCNEQARKKKGGSDKGKLFLL